MDILTHTELQTGKTCLRQTYLRYQLGLKAIHDAIPLRLGKAVHLGLHLKRTTKLTVSSLIEQVLAEYDISKPAGLDTERTYKWEIERVTISAMLKGYFWRWAEYDEQVKYEASELIFELPIINPDSGRSSRTFVIAGVIDAMPTLPDKRLAVMETKTTGEDIGVDSDFWKRLRIDSQISLYFMAAKQLGYNVETIVYDVLRKPSIKPYRATPTDKRKYKKDGSLYANMNDKDETPDEYGRRFLEDIALRPDFYFDRREIPRLKEDIEEFRYELWQNAKLLSECKNHDRWYRNTRACIGFGRCPYFDLCTTGYDIKSGVAPDGFEFVTDLHPELNGE